MPGRVVQARLCPRGHRTAIGRRMCVRSVNSAVGGNGCVEGGENGRRTPLSTVSGVPRWTRTGSGVNLPSYARRGSRLSFPGSRAPSSADRGPTPGGTDLAPEAACCDHDSATVDRSERSGARIWYAVYQESSCRDRARAHTPRAAFVQAPPSSGVRRETSATGRSRGQTDEGAEVAVKRTTSKPRTRRGAADRGSHDGELVQLLTPEGKRVDHPDYAVDLTSRGAARVCTATW